MDRARAVEIAKRWHGENDTIESLADVILNAVLEDDKRIARGYDKRVRYLVAYIQIFIRHFRYPDFAKPPDLDKAEKAWIDANDYNVKVGDIINPTPQQSHKADPVTPS